MLAFDQVQPTVVSQLEIADYIDGLTVVEHAGSQANEKTIADALNNRGVALSVWPPHDTVLIQGTAAQVNMEVELAVFIDLNPERNDPVKRLEGTNDLGDWDAEQNLPDIGSSQPAKGDYYTVSVAGSTGLNDNDNWKVGDVAVFDGAEWQYGPAPKEMFKLVKAAVQAVLAYQGEVKNPRDLFALSESNPIELDTFDAGLYRYHIVFSKRCVL